VVTVLKWHIGKISFRKNYWRIEDKKNMGKKLKIENFKVLMA
jgi:hypothetical protein